MSQTRTREPVRTLAEAPPHIQGGGDRAAAAARAGPWPLPGHASQPFMQRCQLLWAAQRRSWHQPYLTAAFALTIAYRCWHLLEPPTAAWLATALLLSLLDLAWRHASPATHQRSGEAPAALLRLNAFGPPAAWHLMCRLLEDHAAPSHPADSSSGAANSTGLPAPDAASPEASAAGMAVHVARLAFASGAVKRAANELSLRTRLSVSFAVQAALVLASSRHTRAVCATAPFSSPAARRTTAQLQRLLSLLSGSALAFPSSAVAAPGSGTSASEASQATAEAQCVAILTWLRVSVAFCLPLLHEAGAQAALWRRHQLERRDLGLPPEQGAPGEEALYRAAAWLAWQEEDGSGSAGEEEQGEQGEGGLGEAYGSGALHAALVTWLLLAVAWEWCASILSVA